MSTTDTSLKQLIIHSGTQAQIDAAIANNQISENDLVFITDGGDPLNALFGTSDPTVATVGTVGLFYINTVSGDVFHCTAADTVTPAYTWAKFGEGGSGGSNIIIGSTDPTTSTVGTIGQYYINTTSQQCFQLVRIALGSYTWIKQINELNIATTSVPGVTAQSIIWVGPTYSSDGSNELLYADANIRAVSQNTDVVSFICDTIPVQNIKVDIITG